MLAVLVKKPFELEIAQVPDPVLQTPNDVLIRVTGGGICGSDIGIFSGTNSLATYPRIIGHEFGGIVEKIGSGVKNLQPGDLVAVNPVVSCGKCYACTQGRTNVCSTLEVRGVHRDGGFSEFVVVDEQSCHTLNPKKISPELACLVEPFSIGMQINHRGNIHTGDKVLVMGSGPIGLSAMQVAKMRGAKVMMSDVRNERLERAKAMGADEIVNVMSDDLHRRVMEFTNGEGMPVTVDSVCSLESPVLAAELASPAGRVVVLGLSDKPSQFPQVLITKKELDVVGSRLSNHRFPEVIQGFESGQLTPAAMVTHSMPYTKAQEAIELITSHPEKVCKVTLTF